MIRWMRHCAVGAAVLLAACSNDRLGVDPIVVTGNYSATSATFTPASGDPVNLLTAGFTMTMSLDGQGNTSGSLTIPAAFSESHQDETISMAGTYSYNAVAQTVTFDQAADTFVRDVTWAASTGQLAGTFTDDDGSTLRVILTQQ
jgi:hypothetical protein